MPAGYVYILINQSMPGLVKIGRTLRNSRARARELRATGVPTHFELAFEVFSEQHEMLEDAVHEQLARFRVAGDREFFRCPLFDAIQALQQLHAREAATNEPFVAISINAQLRKKYARWVEPSITDIRIVQTEDRVWLEITTDHEAAGYLKDQTIKRSDLAFIMGDHGDDSKMFPPSDSVVVNARRFVDEFDPYSICMATDLFHDQACEEVLASHKSQRAG